MSIMFADLLFGGVLASIGIVAGWWLRGRDSVEDPALSAQKSTSGNQVSDSTSKSAKQGANDQEEEDRRQSQFALEALDRMREMTASVVADVGVHSSRVKEISNELSTATGSDGADVVAAIAKLIQANEHMQSQLADAENRMQEQEKLIDCHIAEARTDALTKLGNRRAFDDEMVRRSAEFARHQRPVCVTMIDVDYFKKFNDTHGHQAGDAVLRGVADVLRKTMREMDVVCRYGGEEFAVVFPGTALADARIGAERARQAIRAATFNFEGTELRVTASLGVAQLMPGEEIETTVKRADDALYASKEAGRNAAHWHDGTNSHRIGAEIVNQYKVQAAQAKQAASAALPSDPAPAPKQQKGAEKPTPAAKPVAASPATTAKVAPATHGSECPLAGLATQELFRADIERRVAEATRGGAPLSVMLFQIDALRKVSLRHGEEVKNVLRGVAVELIRAGAGDMADVARFEKDVFGAMLIGVSLEEAMHTAERIRAAIEKWDSVGHRELLHIDERISFTVSAGVAEVGAGESGDNFVGRAEIALDSATAHGRNRCFVHINDHCKPISSAAPVTA